MKKKLALFLVLMMVISALLVINASAYTDVKPDYTYIRNTKGYYESCATTSFAAAETGTASGAYHTLSATQRVTYLPGYSGPSPVNESQSGVAYVRTSNLSFTYSNVWFTSSTSQVYYTTDKNDFWLNGFTFDKGVHF